MKLNNLDSITINDILSVIKARFTRIQNCSKDIMMHLCKMLEKYEYSQKKIDESLEFIDRVEEKLKELNQPLGRNVEDVYERISAYQVKYYFYLIIYFKK